MNAGLTDRQLEIKVLLDQGKTVRETAETLGVTRNAVYQQMQRMRRDGHLPPQYTQSGRPVREHQAGSSVLTRLLMDTNGNGSELNPERAAAAALAQELQRTRDELIGITQRLTNIVG